jgi:hypothetical protein
MITPENLTAYTPKPGSPLIDGGLDLREMFGPDVDWKDLLGTSVPSGKTFDIGAIESTQD